MAIRVLVSGAGGKMGREVAKAVSAAEGMELVAGVDPHFGGASLGELCGTPGLAIDVVPALEDAAGSRPDVMVDFTAPAAVKANVLQAIEMGIRPVWGTTGLKEPDLAEIAAAAGRIGIGAFHAPNFAIGAVLLMVLSQKVARYMPAAEIVEYHNEMKKDAPSGTAMRTAEMILEAARLPERPTTELYLAEGARGGAVGPIRVHSVRLPGYVAHQEVIFGGLGQTLTLRHDSTSRESFMPGVLLAVRRIPEMTGLVVGLEKLLDLG